MKLTEIPPASAGYLANFYNHQVVSRVPYCFRVSAAEFVRGMGTWADLSGTMVETHDETVFVSEADGAVRGFAHCAHLTISAVGDTAYSALSGGFIHFLAYEPGYRSAGQSLLDACHAWLAERDAHPIMAFYGYAYRFFHLGTPCLSDRLAHVYALLLMNGYRVEGARQVFMERSLQRVDCPQAPSSLEEISVASLPGGTHGGVSVLVSQDGHEVASCAAESGGAFCEAKEAQVVALIDSVGVTEQYRGRGWGRYVTQRALAELAARGHQTAVVGTTDQNARAQLLYTNLGFAVRHRLYSFTRDE